MMNIVQPPILRGTEAAQMAQIRSYLYQLARDLNQALSNLSAENFSSDSEAKTVLSGGLSKEQQKTLQDGLGNLKSLIIKTANEVNKTVETLETELQSKYVASSDFGTYQEEIRTQLQATAEQLNQAISYYAELSDSLGGVSEEFDSYVIEVQGYIRQGIIGYDGAKPIIGIAIGQDLTVLKNADGTVATDILDGREYEKIDTSSNMSIWTPEKLSFYVNGTEIAYFSNGALYVGTVVVNTKLVIGQNNWQIDHGRGFSLKWIGG